MKTILESVSTTSGFLEKAAISFTAGLNCIIGARGTCKSTLVESIRCVFDEDLEKVRLLMIDPFSPEGKNYKSETIDGKFVGMIYSTLGGGTIKCKITDKDEAAVFTIERDALSAPRLYREGVKEHTESDYVHIEIYSQGDLQRIADNEKERLKLIDRPNKREIDDLTRRQKVIAKNLKEKGKEIKDLRVKCNALLEQGKGLPELQAQLSQLGIGRKTPSIELEKERIKFQDRKKILDKLQTIENIRNYFIAESLEYFETLKGIASTLEELRDSKIMEVDEEIKILSKLTPIISNLVNEFEQIKNAPIEEIRSQVESKLDKLNETYYSLRKTEDEVNQSYKQEDIIRKQIDALQARQEELDIAKKKLLELEEVRKKLRAEFKGCADRKYSLRSHQVKQINDAHGGLILMSLKHGSRRDNFVLTVNKLLQGSRLRDQEEISVEITESLTPEDLIDLVESSDSKKLADILNRDLSQMTRLMSYLSDSQELYDLEGLIIEDSLEVNMFDDGKPKPVSTLSNGQKATALLPLILRDADYPLIFDQPEDDLDNKFIFNTLVKAIRKLKQSRQIIFVTHNANIPVLGEAENVIVMKMASAEQAGSPKQGTVSECKEEIISLLEGGKQAFKDREKFYHNLLVQ